MKSFSNQDICFKVLRVNVAMLVKLCLQLQLCEQQKRRPRGLLLFGLGRKSTGPPTPILAGATAILPGLETGVVWPSAMTGTLLKLPECE